LPAELTPLLRQAEASQLWAVLPVDAVMRQQLEAMGLAAGALGPEQAQALAQARAAGIWMTADAREITLVGGVLCPSEAVAKDLTGAIGGQWATMKQPVQDMLQPSIQQLPGDLRDLIADVFGSAAVSANGEVAQASVRLRVAPIEGLVKAVRAAGPAALMASIEQARMKGAAAAAPGGGRENEKALLALVNKARDGEMAPPLKADDRLSRAAAGLAQLAAKDGNFDAIKFPDVVAAGKGAGYPGAVLNASFAISPGKDYDPETILTGWMNNEITKKHLFNNAYTECGIGMASGAGDELFLVFIYARK
jgi:uncharacterized protein YkwD